jgi:hypothetical protein
MNGMIMLFISRCSGLRCTRADTAFEDSSDPRLVLITCSRSRPSRVLIPTALARKLTVRHVYLMRPTSSPSSRRACSGAGMPHAHGWLQASII